MKIIITGGHHSSALPVINLLQEKHPEAKLYWFGHKYSAQGDKNPTLEFKEICALGIPFYPIQAGKFYKTINLVRLAKIPLGFFQCLYLLFKIKPQVILSFGGYIAVPTVIAGWILGIPCVTHEQTVVAGWANRVISKFAQKVLISWPQSSTYFPKKKTVFVGLPLRKAIFQSLSNNFSVQNNLPTIYITTGKIGSHVINNVVSNCLANLLEFCNVIHQCGDNSVFNDFEHLSSIKESLGSTKGQYYLRKFVLEDEIGEAFSKSRLVVSRSGAHTTSELMALNKPCLLIPIPWVSHNEQYLNATVLAQCNLGVILPESQLSPKSLVENIKILLQKTNADYNKSPVKAESTEPETLIVKHLFSVI